jgi:hypothetical protein
LIKYFVCIKKTTNLALLINPKPKKMQIIESSIQKESGYAIGFSGTYYCLWSWRLEKTYEAGNNGQYHITDSYRKYSYIKRISTDIEKVKSLYPNYEIQEDLRGRKWDWDDSPVRNKPTETQFPIGRLRGQDILTSADTKALWSLYLAPDSGIGRNKVYARRRLAELGLLVPYKWSKTVKGLEGDTVIRRSYCSPKHVEKLEAEKVRVKGLFYNDGEKVTLDVKEVRSFTFATQFGTCFVIEYVDTDNRIFKYKGSKPPYFENNDTFTTIKATIKHSNYKGQDETLIQRISII